MKLTFFAVAITALLISASSIQADEYVRGYYRKDGTYVAPHYRSSPDRNPYNNYSFPGNTNPYTGRTAPGNSDTYLERYNNRNNNSYGNYDGNPYQNPYGNYGR